MAEEEGKKRQKPLTFAGMFTINKWNALPTQKVILAFYILTIY
jgi:hypothetical protein